MQVMLPILYALAFIFLIYKIDFFLVPSISRNVFAAVFILKIIAGIVLFNLYTYYYDGGDTLTFFNDGNAWFHSFIHHPQLSFKAFFGDTSFPVVRNESNNFGTVLYNDARTMIAFNFIMRFFSLGYFHVHTVFMCFASLIGCTALYKTFLPYFSTGKKLLFSAVFLIPSVLFWTSGVLKEGPLLFGLGMLLYSTNCGFRTTYNPKRIIIILISVLLLLLVKPYVLIALLPGLVFNKWIYLTSTKHAILKYTVVILFWWGMLLSLSIINDDYNPLKIIAKKQALAISEAKGGTFLVNEKHFIRIDCKSKFLLLKPVSNNKYRINAGSRYMQWNLNNMKDTTFVTNSTDTSEYTHLYEVIPANTTLELNPLQPSLYSIIVNAPKAFLNVMIQPLIWKAKNFLELLAAIENLFLIGLCVIVAVFFNRSIKNKTMIAFCFGFVVIVYVLIGLTTPVIGAIVRYKVPALPFLCIGLCMLVDKEKIIRTIPFMARWMN